MLLIVVVVVLVVVAVFVTVVDFAVVVAVLVAVKSSQAPLDPRCLAQVCATAICILVAVVVFGAVAVVSSLLS